MLRNGVELVPARLVIHEGDGHSNATESSRPADAV